MPVDRRDQARTLMDAFADRTGVLSGRHTRYLWTDAFAVANLLGLGETDQARRLVDQVHHVLGRHRDDDPRTGWLSGLDEEEGEARPTAGGLRIGKPLPERAPREPMDERLEWERDGQYFHYLTRWMHALRQMWQGTNTRRYLDQAVELARVSHAAFVVRPGRMAWKMSVDLSRPQVASMGQHDPLDGLVTFSTLRAAVGAEVLKAPIRDMAEMSARLQMATADPLGLGGLLVDAHRIATLGERATPVLRSTMAAILEAAARGLELVERQQMVRQDPAHRLAFRELGLCIGLSAVARSGALARLERFVPIGEALLETWRADDARRLRSWRDHLDINEVMLATALDPEGYLS